MQIGRVQSALAGAAVGAASGFVPGAGSLAAASVAQGAVNFALDRFDPVQPFRPTPLPLLAGLGQGLVTGLAAHFGGPLAGLAVGALLGAWRPGMRPAAQASLVGLQSMHVPELQQQNLTGRGVGVAILDSGCAPVLPRPLEAFHDVIEPGTPAHDVDKHGTAVAGLIAEIAPDANLIAVRVANEDHTVDSAAVLKALDWVQENRQRYNIQVVNMSFGLEDSGMLKVVDKLKDLREQGLLLVTSAGNDGPTPRRFTAFKSSPDVLTVGCSDTRGTVDPGDDRLGRFSSRARPGSPKGPDFVVPSDNLVSLSPQGKSLQFADGMTSLAAARASGVLALWKEACPQSTLEQVREAIQQTATPLGGEDSLAQGSGLLQAASGLEVLRQP